jgi:hypothetical protein
MSQSADKTTKSKSPTLSAGQSKPYLMVREDQMKLIQIFVDGVAFSGD